MSIKTSRDSPVKARLARDYKFTLSLGDLAQDVDLVLPAGILLYLSMSASDVNKYDDVHLVPANVDTGDLNISISVAKTNGSLAYEVDVGEVSVLGLQLPTGVSNVLTNHDHKIHLEKQDVN